MADTSYPDSAAPSGELIELQCSSPEAIQMGNLLANSYLDPSYNSTLRTVSVHKVHNPELERQFLKKAAELKATGRAKSEVAEIFGFTVARKSIVYLKKIINEGLRAQKTDYNAFGDSSKGVYISKHCDVMLKFAESHNTKFLRIIVHKVIPGRLLSTKHGPEIIMPTPNFDGHVSLTSPSINISLEMQVMLSQLYLYELDTGGNPLPHPRHCLPYAVFTFERQEPINPVPGLPLTCPKVEPTTVTTTPASSVTPTSSGSKPTCPPSKQTCITVTDSMRSRAETLLRAASSHPQIAAQPKRSEAVSVSSVSSASETVEQTPNSNVGNRTTPSVSSASTTATSKSAQNICPKLYSIRASPQKTDSATRMPTQIYQRVVLPSKTSGGSASNCSANSQSAILIPVRTVLSSPQSMARHSPAINSGAQRIIIQPRSTDRGQIQAIRQATPGMSSPIRYIIPAREGQKTAIGNLPVNIMKVNQQLQQSPTVQNLNAPTPIRLVNYPLSDPRAQSLLKNLSMGVVNVNQGLRQQLNLQNHNISYAHSSGSSFQTVAGSPTSSTASNSHTHTSVANQPNVNVGQASSDIFLSSVKPIEIAPIEGYGEVPPVQIKQEKEHSRVQQRQRCSTVINLDSDNEETDGQQPAMQQTEVPNQLSEPRQEVSNQGVPKQGETQDKSVNHHTEEPSQYSQENVLVQHGIQPGVSQQTVFSQQTDLQGYILTVQEHRTKTRSIAEVHADEQTLMNQNEEQQSVVSELQSNQPAVTQHESDNDGPCKEGEELSSIEHNETGDSEATVGYEESTDNTAPRDGEKEPKKVLHEYVRTSEDGSIEVVQEMVLESELHERRAEVSGVSTSHNWELESCDEDDDGEDTSMDLSHSEVISTDASQHQPNEESLDKRRTEEEKLTTTNLNSREESEENQPVPSLTPSVIASDLIVQRENELTTSVETANCPKETSPFQCPSREQRPVQRSETEIEPSELNICITSVTSLTGENNSTENDRAKVKCEKESEENESIDKDTEAVEISGTFMPSQEILTDLGPNFDISNLRLPQFHSEGISNEKDGTFASSILQDHDESSNMSNSSSSTSTLQTSGKNGGKKASGNKKKSPNINPTKKLKIPRPSKPKPDKMVHGTVRTVSFKELMSRANQETDPLSSVSSDQPTIKEGDMESRSQYADTRGENVPDNDNDNTTSFQEINRSAVYQRFGLAKWKAAEKDPMYQPFVKLDDINRLVEEAHPRSPVHYSDEDYELPTNWSRLKIGPKKKSKAIPQWSPARRMLLTARKSVTKGHFKPDKQVTLSHPSFASSTNKSSLSFTTTTLLGSMDSLCVAGADKRILPTLNTKEVSHTDKEEPEKSRESGSKSPILATDPSESCEKIRTIDDDNENSEVHLKDEIRSTENIGGSSPAKKPGYQAKKNVKKGKQQAKKWLKPMKAKPKRNTQKDIENSSSGSETPYPRRMRKEKDKILPVRRGRSLKAIIPLNYAEEPETADRVYTSQILTEEKRIMGLVKMATEEALAEKSTSAGDKSKPKLEENVPIEPYFDPQIPLVREDPTYVERMMYNPEIPGILDVPIDEGKKEDPPSQKVKKRQLKKNKESPIEKQVKNEEREAESKPKLDFTDPINLVSEDQQFLAILQARLKMAKTVEEAESLKATIAVLCPSTSKTQNANQRSSEADRGNNEKSTTTVKSTPVKINLDDYDYEDEDDTNLQLPSTVKQEAEDSLREEEDTTHGDIACEDTTPELSCPNTQPDEGLEDLQDERWKILQSLEDLEDEVEGSPHATVKNDLEEKQMKSLNASESKDQEKCMHKGKSGKLQKRRTHNKNKRRHSNNISEGHDSSHNSQSYSAGSGQKGLSESKHILSSESDDDGMKSRLRKKKKTHKKKATRLDISDEDRADLEGHDSMNTQDKKLPNSTASLEISESKGRAPQRKKLYTDSEVIRNMISPKAALKKAVETNLFDGYSNEDTKALNTSSNVDQWFQKLNQLSKSSNNQRDTNVLNQIMASTRPKETTAEGQSVGNGNESKGAACPETEVHEANLQTKECPDHDQTQNKPKEPPIADTGNSKEISNCSEDAMVQFVEKKKPAKVKLDLKTYLARNADKNSPTTMDISAGDQTMNTSEHMQLQVSQGIALGMQLPKQLPELKDIMKILETVKKNEAALNAQAPPETVVKTDTALAKQVQPEIVIKSPTRVDPRLARSSAPVAKGVMRPEQRINYLQNNLEQIRVKRKELIVEVNSLKMKLNSPESNPKVDQGVQVLDHFIIGLYIDEEIIKREMDNVRGNVKAQPNQPFPPELLLPEEAALQETSNKIPLILMSKLLNEKYENLLSLKLDYIATNEEWKRTNVLDADKKRSLQRNFMFLKDQRNRSMTALCKSGDLKQKVREYSEKMAWYKKFHESFLKDFKHIPNPCTEARLRHIDKRIEELNVHIKHLLKILELPLESIVPPKKEERKSAPKLQPSQQQVGKKLERSSSLGSDASIHRGTTSTSSKDDVTTCVERPPAFAKSDVKTPKDMPLSFPDGDLPPWLKKTKDIPPKPKDIPPWLKNKRGQEVYSAGTGQRSEKIVEEKERKACNHEVPIKDRSEEEAKSLNRDKSFKTARRRSHSGEKMSTKILPVSTSCKVKESTHNDGSIDGNRDTTPTIAMNKPPKRSQDKADKKQQTKDLNREQNKVETASGTKGEEKLTSTPNLENVVTSIPPSEMDQSELLSTESNQDIVKKRLASSVGKVHVKKAKQGDATSKEIKSDKETPTLRKVIPQQSGSGDLEEEKAKEVSSKKGNTDVVDIPEKVVLTAVLPGEPNKTHCHSENDTMKPESYIKTSASKDNADQKRKSVPRMNTVEKQSSAKEKCPSLPGSAQSDKTALPDTIANDSKRVGNAEPKETKQNDIGDSAVNKETESSSATTADNSANKTVVDPLNSEQTFAPVKVQTCDDAQVPVSTPSAKTGPIETSKENGSEDDSLRHCNKLLNIEDTQIKKSSTQKSVGESTELKTQSSLVNKVAKIFKTVPAIVGSTSGTRRSSCIDSRTKSYDMNSASKSRVPNISKSVQKTKDIPSTAISSPQLHENDVKSQTQTDKTAVPNAAKSLIDISQLDDQAVITTTVKSKREELLKQIRKKKEDLTTILARNESQTTGCAPKGEISEKGDCCETTVGKPMNIVKEKGANDSSQGNEAIVSDGRKMPSMSSKRRLTVEDTTVTEGPVGATQTEDCIIVGTETLKTSLDVHYSVDSAALNKSKGVTQSLLNTNTSPVTTAPSQPDGPDGAIQTEDCVVIGTEIRETSLDIGPSGNSAALARSTGDAQPHPNKTTAPSQPSKVQKRKPPKDDLIIPKRSCGAIASEVPPSNSRKSSGPSVIRKTTKKGLSVKTVRKNSDQMEHSKGNSDCVSGTHKHDIEPQESEMQTAPTGDEPFTPQANRMSKADVSAEVAALIACVKESMADDVQKAKHHLSGEGESESPCHESEVEEIPPWLRKDYKRSPREDSRHIGEGYGAGSRGNKAGYPDKRSCDFYTEDTRGRTLERDMFRRDSYIEKEKGSPSSHHHSDQSNEPHTPWQKFADRYRQPSWSTDSREWEEDMASFKDRDHKRQRSRSPHRKGSREGSPWRREIRERSHSSKADHHSRSQSPYRKRSGSPHSHRSHSPSPRYYRSKSRSRSPHEYKQSCRRDRSPQDSRYNNKWEDRERRHVDHKGSPFSHEERHRSDRSRRGRGRGYYAKSYNERRDSRDGFGEAYRASFARESNDLQRGALKQEDQQNYQYSNHQRSQQYPPRNNPRW